MDMSISIAIKKRILFDLTNPVFRKDKELHDQYEFTHIPTGMKISVDCNESRVKMITFVHPDGSSKKFSFVFPKEPELLIFGNLVLKADDIAKDFTKYIQQHTSINNYYITEGDLVGTPTNSNFLFSFRYGFLKSISAY